VRFGRRNAEQMMQVLDFTPAGAAFVGNEAALSAREGKRGEAAANVALAALPIPGAGKAAKKVAKGAAPAKAAAPDFSEGFGTFKSGPTKIIWEDNKDGTIELISLRTPAAKRGQGSARTAMQEFLAEADARGLNVSLGASPLDERTKSNRLVDFYKSLGFEPTGRRINMAGDPAMLRKAASAVEKSMAVNPAKKTAPPKPARTKYQAVEPVETPHPELADVQFPQGAGLGGSFAIANRVPIVGRRPFMAQSSKGYSGLSGSVPANRVTADVRNVVNMRPEVVISPEEIAKRFGSGIPLIGDKLIAGTALSRVNDRAQVGETLSMGGPDYSRIAEALGGLEAWKSSPAVIGGLETMRKSGEDLYGKPVAGIYTTMGATGLDQSTSMMDLLGRQLAAGGVRKDDLLDFDDAVKGILGKDAAEDFIGFAKDRHFKSEDAAAYRHPEITRQVIGTRKRLPRHRFKPCRSDCTRIAICP
jgi:hypothetical protein